MPLSEEQLRLAKRIDEHTNRVLSDETGYGPLLMSLPEYMEDFGRVMEISTREEMNELCERYDGFYRFAKFMEEFARGLADGSIPRMP